MVAALPLVAGMYAGAIIVGMGELPLDTDRLPYLIPSLMLVVLYLVIGHYLTRTQLANRRPSAAGAYTLSGLYPLDIHTRVIDLLAAPAAVCFVWVAQAPAGARSATGAGPADRLR